MTIVPYFDKPPVHVYSKEAAKAFENIIYKCYAVLGASMTCNLDAAAQMAMNGWLVIPAEPGKKQTYCKWRAVTLESYHFDDLFKGAPQNTNAAILTGGGWPSLTMMRTDRSLTVPHYSGNC